MALKIRLRQMGRTNHLVYRLVVTDSRAPRDGKYLEGLGFYNPHVDGNKNIMIIEDRVQHWLNVGAKCTEKAKHLISRSSPGVIKFLESKSQLKKQKAKKKKNKNKK